MNNDATQLSYHVMIAFIKRWLGGVRLPSKLRSNCVSRNGRAFGLFLNFFFEQHLNFFNGGKERLTFKMYILISIKKLMNIILL